MLGGSDGKQTHRECWAFDLHGGCLEVVRYGSRRYSAWTCGDSRQQDLPVWRLSDVADLTGCRDAVYQRDSGGRWDRISSLPHGRVAMPAKATVRGRVYLFGGCAMPRPGTVMNISEAYSFDTGSRAWKKLRSVPHPNRGIAAAAIDEHRIVLYGGYTDSGFTSDVLVYDTRTDTYQEAEKGPLAAAGVELLYHSGVLFAAGGETACALAPIVC